MIGVQRVKRHSSVSPWSRSPGDRFLLRLREEEKEEELLFSPERERKSRRPLFGSSEGTGGRGGG